MFQLESEGRNSPQFEQLGKGTLIPGGSVFLFYLGPTDWMRSTTLGRAVCFTQSTNSNAHLIPKHPHRDTQHNVRPHI